GGQFMERVPEADLPEQLNSVDERASLRPDVGITETQKFRPQSSVVEFLKSFLPEDKFSKLGLTTNVFDGDLEVWLQIKYPNRKRVLPNDTVKLVDDLAIAMRDQDESALRLKLGDGTEVKGSELKISTNVPVETIEGTPNL